MTFKRRPDEDFSDEVRAHLDLETARLMEDGMSAQDARAAARKAFGNVMAAQERFHESTRWVWFEQFAQDVRYAVRGLTRSRAFMATSVLTLAVGLSLLTVAFTVFNAYVLRPYAVQDPGQLYRMAWRAPENGGQIFSWRDYDELRARTDLFDAALAEDTRMVSSDGQLLSAAYVSDNYFTALVPRLVSGRGLAPVDSEQPVCVLGHQAALRLFGGEDAAIGRDLDIDGKRVVVSGVLGPEFGGLDEYPRDIWMPAALGGKQKPVEIVARLRRDVAVSRAEAMLASFAVTKAPVGTDPKQVRAALLPNATANAVTFELLAVLAPIFAAFVLVQLTACANVSNVMLARAVARHREIAVRLSLGASRSRIVRQLLTEGLLIAILAGATGLALASWTLRGGLVLLMGTLPPSFAAIVRVVPMTFDYRVFAFALGVAVLATLGFALLPALQASRQPLTNALRGQRSGTRSSSRLRSALVVAQVAVSTLLVVGALVLSRNFASIGATDLGYATAGVYSVNVRGEEPGAVKRAMPELVADPRLAEVAVTSWNPLFIQRVSIAAGPASGSTTAPTRYTFVSPEYFTVLRIPISRGRAFRTDEAQSDARVAIVSDATARAFWPGADPVGQRIRIAKPEGQRRIDELPGYSEVIVVGTVKDVVSGFIVEGRDAGHIYLPTSSASPHAGALMLRPRASSNFRPDMLRETFRRLGYDPETFEVLPMADMRDTQMYPLRAGAWIGGLLGAIALVLSISGLYGVLSYMLSQRTREIGIRMALGATGGAVVSLVVRQSVRLAGVGAAIGLVIAAIAMKLLSAIITLKEVSLLDVAPFAVAAVVALGATALAAWQPARRATRVDPSETLRAEA
jgi:predicted permease